MKLAVFNVKSISIRSNKSSKRGYDQYDVSIINFIHDKASAKIYCCVSFFIVAVIVCKRCNLSYNLYYTKSKSISVCVCPPLFFFEFRLCPFTHPPKDWREADCREVQLISYKRFLECTHVQWRLSIDP